MLDCRLFFQVVLQYGLIFLNIEFDFSRTGFCFKKCQVQFNFGSGVLTILSCREWGLLYAEFFALVR